MHSLKDIKIPDFDASKENIIAIPSDSGPKDKIAFGKLYYHFCEKLSDAELILYTLICSRAAVKPEGYAFFVDEHAMEVLHWKRRKVQRIMESLETKKMIYRNTWWFKTGSVRHIIPAQKAKTYFVNFLNTNRVRDQHKEEFLPFLTFHNPDLKVHIIPYKPSKRVMNKVMNNLDPCYAKNDATTIKKDTPPTSKIAHLCYAKNSATIATPKIAHILDNLIDNRIDKENILSDAVAQPPEGAAPAKPIKQLHKELALYVQKQFPFSNEAKIQPMAEYCELKAGGREDKLYYGNKIFAKCILNFLLIAREPHIAQQTRKYIEENDIKSYLNEKQRI